MFEAVRGQSEVRSRTGLGIAISVVSHALVWVLALQLDNWMRRDDPPQPEPEVKWPVVQLSGFTPPPAVQGPRPKGARRAAVKPALVAPAAVPEPDAERAEAEDVPDEIPEVIGARINEAAGDPDGDAAVKSAPGNTHAGWSGDARPFTSEMTTPMFVAGPEIRYTREAAEAGVQGRMIVQCVITAKGLVRDCRSIKPVPYMEHEVIKTLRRWRFTPARTPEGVAFDVVFSFEVDMVMR